MPYSDFGCGPRIPSPYRRGGSVVISTKLPIVKDVIEIITYIQTYENDMKMVLDRYTVKRRIRCKAETHVKLYDTCKALRRDT